MTIRKPDGPVSGCCPVFGCPVAAKMYHLGTRIWRVTVQLGSENRKNPDFKWSILLRMPNGPFLNGFTIQNPDLFVGFSNGHWPRQFYKEKSHKKYFIHVTTV